MNSNAMQYNSGRKKKEAKQKLSKTSSNTNTNTKQVLKYCCTYQLADKHVAVVLVFLHVPTFNMGFVKDQCFTKHAIHCFYVTCVPIVQGLVEREGAIETILHVGYIFSAPIIDGLHVLLGSKRKNYSKQHWKQTVLCSNIFLFYLIEYFCPKKQSFEVRAVAHVPRMNGFVERFVVDKDLRKILDERDIEIVDLAVRSVAFLLINFNPLD
jgi:hypothetical protein